jgi:D-3-phosphoglycerate dehydrogenase / 2-oxoglutarate reductase
VARRAEPVLATIGHRFPDADVEVRALEGRGVQVRYLGGRGKEEAIAAARDADGVLLGVSFDLDAEALARLESCRVVVRYGIGLDNVDVAAAERRGIRVLNVPDYGIEEVANHALALLLALARRLDVLAERARAGNWSGAIAGLRLRRLSVSKLLVIGAGRIGRALVERAMPIWGEILVYDPLMPDDAWLRGHARRVDDLDAALAEADFVSLHVPATEATRGMLSAPRLASLKAGAVLVNCSRGDVVDEDALLGALASGRLAAAGLDVFAGEPNPRPELLGAENVWPTPHAAWFSTASVVDLRHKAALAAAAVLTSAAKGSEVTP